MTDVPDFRGRIESDKPQDFMHRLAAVIPGYTGYQDRERRRDADRQVRTFLARRFQEQQSALVRAQQQLARSGQLRAIAEVDRLAGVLQRFVDKLQTATQGYAGLFDPIKIDNAELDQLYTFDAALTAQLQQVSDAVAAVGAAAQQGSGPAPAETAGKAPDLQTALTQLGTVLDDVLTTWNHRNEVIMSGRPLPPAEFQKFRATAGAGAPTAPLGGSPPPSGGPGYGAPQGGQGGYGSAPGGQSGYGAPQGGQGAYGAQQGGQSSYGSAPGGQSGYGAPQGGQSQGGYGTPPAGGQPYPPPAGQPGGQPGSYGGAPGGGQPYQPYAGPAGGESDVTQPIPPAQMPPASGPVERPSGTNEGPTGGPADHGLSGR